MELLGWVRENLLPLNIASKSHYKSIISNSVRLNYWGKVPNMFHRDALLSYYITNQSMRSNSCCTIEMIWRKCSIIEQCWQIPSQINSSDQSFMEILSSAGENISYLGILSKSSCEWIILTRTLIIYGLTTKIKILNFL